MRRQSAPAREPMRASAALGGSRGLRPRVPRRPRRDDRANDRADVGAEPRVIGRRVDRARWLVRDDADRSHRCPCDSGLGLLEETPASRVALDRAERPDRCRPAVRRARRWHGDRYMMRGEHARGDQVRRHAARTSTARGGVRRMAARSVARRARHSDGAGRSLAAAVMLVALAVRRLVTGHGAVAVALGQRARVARGLHRRAGAGPRSTRMHAATTIVTAVADPRAPGARRR